tara:strand:- start:11731 stop:11943 length:213 start_codon:yes stop_codon:yes gene_type:complete
MSSFGQIETFTFIKLSFEFENYTRHASPQSGHSAAEFYSGLSSQFLLGINADLRKVACLKKRMANAMNTK